MTIGPVSLDLPVLRDQNPLLRSFPADPGERLVHSCAVPGEWEVRSGAWMRAGLENRRSGDCV